MRAVDDDEEEDDDIAHESPRTRDTEVQSPLRGGGRSAADDEAEEAPMGAHHDGYGMRVESTCRDACL